MLPQFMIIPLLLRIELAIDFLNASLFVSVFQGNPVDRNNK